CRPRSAQMHTAPRRAAAWPPAAATTPRENSRSAIAPGSRTRRTRARPRQTSEAPPHSTVGPSFGTHTGLAREQLMRDILAGVVAFALLVIAASLATTLKYYRLRRQRTMDGERALGRTV